MHCVSIAAGSIAASEDFRSRSSKVLRSEVGIDHRKLRKPFWGWGYRFRYLQTFTEFLAKGLDHARTGCAILVFTLDIRRLETWLVATRCFFPLGPIDFSPSLRRFCGRTSWSRDEEHCLIRQYAPHVDRYPMLIKKMSIQSNSRIFVYRRCGAHG
jgi:hypothetical protein